MDETYETRKKSYKMRVGKCERKGTIVESKLACEGGVETDLTDELLCLMEWL
jgi:hypothetical protein